VGFDAIIEHACLVVHCMLQW